MSIPLITIHVVISVIIILIVLLQVGKGAEAGAMFGGTGQAYSMRGANTFVGKLTTGLAVAFMLTSLLLTYYTSNRAKSSVIDTVSQEKTERAAPAEDSPQKQDTVLPGKAIPIDDFEEGKTKPAASKAIPAKSVKVKKTPPASPKTENKAPFSPSPTADKKSKQTAPSSR